jgi:toxin ParE1/3/4
VRRLVYLAGARRDLLAILRYVSRDAGSVKVGRRFVDVLRGQCAKLASLPGTLGTARPELLPEIRSFPCRGYVIFFRYRDGILEVVNILEGHQDIDARFGRRGLD